MLSNFTVSPDTASIFDSPQNMSLMPHKSPLRCDITAEQTPPSQRKFVPEDGYLGSSVRRAIDFSIYSNSDEPVGAEKPKDSKCEAESAKDRTSSIHEKQYKDVYYVLLNNELNSSCAENSKIFSSIYSDKEDFARSNTQPLARILTNNSSTLFSTTPGVPYSYLSQKVLRTNIQEYRKICSHPFKVLDAPGLPNDYYLNLLDWSRNDVVAVALNNKVYLWDFSTCKVTNIMDAMSVESSVSCVRWCPTNGNVIMFSTNNGVLYLYDTVAQKCQKRIHITSSQRVGCADWNGSVLTTGARDGVIRSVDVRTDCSYVMCNIHGHSLEVCGLKWDHNHQLLASGGNDNRIFLWNLNQAVPIDNLQGHQGAVKALAWSPHEHGLLASGGGSADRCIKFWNTQTQKLVNSIDTQSQVCNLEWSNTEQEIVSTHGFSSNSINLWTYPNMNKLVSLKGHTSRVVYMSRSPDGEKIVTGSSDETLRFWNIFSKNNTILNKNELDMHSHGILH